MTTSLAMRFVASFRRRSLAMCALGCLALTGCQALAPTSGLPGLASLAEDRQLAKLAEHDPFPTPAEVGIEAK